MDAPRDRLKLRYQHEGFRCPNCGWAGTWTGNLYCIHCSIPLEIVVTSVYVPEAV